MPFLPCSLFFLLLSSFFFFFSLLFLFQFSLFLTLDAMPLSFMATIPIYTRLTPLGFSILPLLLPNHFCLLWAPFQSYPLVHWPLNFHYTRACLVLSLSSTTYFTTKPYLFDSAMILSLSSDGQSFRFLSAYLYSMHQVVPVIYYLFWAKMHS